MDDLSVLMLQCRCMYGEELVISNKKIHGFRTASKLAESPLLHSTEFLRVLKTTLLVYMLPPMYVSSQHN